jgi:uncharacterized protein
MISNETIEEVKQRLIKAYKPLKIYLFGSYAWGHPTEDSDLDLLIVIEHYEKDRHDTLVDGQIAMRGLDISKDILVYSKEEWEKFSTDNTRLCYKVRKEGKQIYAKA